MATVSRTTYAEFAPADGHSRLPLLGGSLAVALGLGGGLAVALGNPILPFAAIAGLLMLAFLLASAERLLVGALLVAVLLPFAVVPVKLVITPAFLEGLILLLAAVTLTRLMRGGRLNVSPIHAPLLVFIGLTVFAFILGIARDFSTDIAHNYFRMFLGFVLFYLVVALADAAMLLRLTRWFIGAGGLAALLGIVLWALGARAERFLLLLRVVGYPTDNVIRYLEANPALPVRATGTAVDPNSYAGMLVLVFSLALAQMLAARKGQVDLPRWVLWGTVAASGAALILTQSRSAWLGAAAAAGLMAFLRYRRLFVYGVGGLVLVLGLGVGSSYLSRFQAGLALQDPATIMRLNEYANAVQIIQKYPWFGVGFGTAGGFERELTTGVSSVYLTIAERMGLVGLAGFAFVMFTFFAYTLPRLRRTPSPTLRQHGRGGKTGPALLRNGGGGGRKQIGRGERSSERTNNGSPLPTFATGVNQQEQSASAPHSTEIAAEIETQNSKLSTILLGATAAVAGALVVGVLDHYFFNIEFPHMVMLFWLCAAIAVVAAQQIEVGEKELVSNGA